ncbi:MAG: hypothetical protein C0623_00155 [Desulfuromonas sp.]|nr:MAG: hypothetical protein C0623_00155 [Desulfuromonas sp.]
MAETKSDPDKLSRLDADLEIMDAHAGEMAEVEESIQESMKKRDREYKDSHLHSVPKGKKHRR